jgi:hypothetical protein
MITSLGKTQLGHTAVSARLDEPLADGTNLLFCSTFQMAWNELRAEFGGAVRLECDPPLAKALEQEGPTAEDVDAHSCVVGGGTGPAFVAKIDRELRQKFGNRDDFMLPERLDPGTVLAYAYLSKDLVFDTPFAFNRDIGMPFRRGQKVAYFGVWTDGDDKLRSKRAKQVIVHHSADDGSFVLEMLTKAEGDRLIIARIPRAPTLLETVDAALAHANQKKGLWSRVTGGADLGGLDIVRVPLIDVDLLRSFVELAGRKLVGRDAFIQDAKQRIRFKLDEKGAILRSAGVILTPRGGPQGKRYVCDEPFLVAMIRKGRRYPYFALWVEDKEVLVPVSDRIAT